jgi:hypothetical protein
VVNGRLSNRQLAALLRTLRRAGVETYKDDLLGVTVVLGPEPYRAPLRAVEPAPAPATMPASATGDLGEKEDEW